MNKKAVIANLKKAVEQVKLSNQALEVIERTVIHIPDERIDQSRSVLKASLDEKYIYISLYALSNRSIPLELTFSKMIDFYSDEASIFEMEELGSHNNHICQVINMWLTSTIEKAHFKRGDYIGRTDYIGSHKYMSSRRLFTKTSPFGRFGRREVESKYEPWIVI